METIDVAIRRHRIEDGQSVDVIGERQLHENTVSSSIFLAGNALNDCHQRGCLDSGRNVDHFSIETNACGSVAFALDVRGTGREFTNEHNH